MRNYVRLTSGACILGTTLLCATGSVAQEAVSSDDDIVYLSPFEVTSEGTIGYAARDTLAGTRLRTDLRDVANAVQVVNSQFLQDTGATDTKSLLVYTTNTEVGGVGGNFSNLRDGNAPDDTASRVSPQSNTRVRGLDSADNTRNFFLTRTPWDSYNVDRVDIQRGANSILFGIGSPAGIINTNMQGATLFNEGKIEMKVGSYGTVRGSFNVNRVILDGELSVRVAGLYEDEQYRQDPAFEQDERIYVAARWEPEFMKIGSSKFTLKVNYERGDIEANRPRVTPPYDRMTAWWTDPKINRKIYDGSVINNNNAANYDPSAANASSYGALQSSFTDGTANPNYSAWLTYWGGDTGGPIVVFPDVNSPEQSVIFLGQVMNRNFATYTGTAPTSYLSNAGIAVTSVWAGRVGAVGSGIGAWKDQMITDPSIFDFYNKLLDGDTKRELENWEAYNITMSETFMDDMFGIEFSYDYQRDEQEYRSRIQNAGYSLCIDLNQYYMDGSINPNAGKVYVASRSQGFSDEEVSKTLRGTAYVDLDFKKFFDPESLLVKILGRQVFQGNYTNLVQERDFKTWMGLTAGEGFYDSADIGTFGRFVSTMSYLSGSSVAGTSTPSGLNLSRINATRDAQSGSVLLLDSPDGTYANASYQNVPITIWSDSNKEDMKNLYRGSNTWRSETETDTWGLVWNGYMLDNILVPTVGYRSDKQVYRYTGPATGGNAGIADFTSPEWYLPSSEADALTSTGEKTGRRYASVDNNTTAWGLVLHTPEFIKNKLPWGLDLSVFYNDSDNFRPDASRIDIYGNTLASPTGTTKDYGFVLSAFEDRVTFKVNWYESKVTNATLNSAISGLWAFKGEGWAYQQMLNSAYHAGNFTTDFRSDTTVGEYLPWQPGGGMTEAETLALWKASYTAMIGVSPDQVGTQAYLNVENPLNPTEAWQRNWFNQTTFKEWRAQVDADPTHSMTFWNNIQDPKDCAITGDTQSEGIEFELTAQITKNWNVAVNVSKTRALRMNLAGSFTDFTLNRAQVYAGAYGDARLWNGNYDQTATLRYLFNNTFYGNYLMQRALEGAEVPELCKWRFNIVTNYSFDEGLLKGVNVGAGYRWQDKVVIGYPVINDADGNETYDIDNPYKGDAEHYLDMWVGYEHAINDDVTWRIQLNVKNLFADDDLIPVSCQPDGTYATVRIPDETTWYLTNTFTF